ncbi:glycosyltransferase family 2 protein [Marichromatium bheemlicum]|uniref:Glycosyltransferase family 2 protein n=1 Tax=Marichromatium bheemlicum TaxID=365339 RepID=A0ABX1I602_9GAMM|nr:glycosyltransferase family 2 protein [Marichromatium bheemlicum]NKN32912.1 glycosyltransferase family 2 protein [Marichromatium bheemlicum]
MKASLSITAGDQADAVVVIVNYNAGDYLRRCLAALAAQCLKPRAVVLVDNASSDGSLEGLEQDYPELLLVRSDQNLGFAAANNLGVREAPETTWVVTLNPDAFPAPDWLEQMLKAAHERPGYAMFSSCLLCDDASGRLDGAGDCYHTSGLVWRRRHGQVDRPSLGAGEVFAPCAAAAMYRRQAFEEVGGFDEDFFCYLEDVDLAFRLRLAGERCWYVPAARVVHLGSAVTGYRSDFSTYYGQRNMVWTYLQNMPGALLWRSMPLFVLVNLAALVVGWRRGQLGVVARAKRDALRGLQNSLRKRQARQACRRVESAVLARSLTHGWRALLQRSRAQVS